MTSEPAEPAADPPPTRRTATAWDVLRLCFGTLTAIPVRPPARLGRPVAGRAMLLAPLAGIVPGLVGAGLALAADRLGVPAGAAAALVLAGWALSTRGLHLDGLADTADGLSASYNRQRALEVMRRGDVGPSGVAALVLVLLLQATTLGGALAAGHWLLPLVAAVLARLALPLACYRTVPAARPEGLGAVVAGSVPRGPLLVVTGLTTLAGTAVAVAGDVAPWWSVPLAAAAGLAATGLLVRRAVRRFGGVTGDVLGACVETAATVVLLVLVTAR